MAFILLEFLIRNEFEGTMPKHNSIPCHCWCISDPHSHPLHAVVHLFVSKATTGSILPPSHGHNYLYTSMNGCLSLHQIRRCSVHLHAGMQMACRHSLKHRQYRYTDVSPTSHWDQWLCPWNFCIPIDMNGTACMRMHRTPVHPVQASKALSYKCTIWPAKEATAWFLQCTCHHNRSNIFLHIQWNILKQILFLIIKTFNLLVIWGNACSVFFIFETQKTDQAPM